MDIMEEIKFPSKDSEWTQKVLIGGVVAIIPIVNLIACGYLLNGIPVLGMLIMIFGGFYTGAVAYNMFGKVCARSKA